MRFHWPDFAGREFRIRFEHEHFPVNDAPLTHCHPIPAGGTKYGKVRAVTTCYIEGRKLVTPPNPMWGIVAEGVARCSLDDRFQKEVGRKLALERALIGRDHSFRKTVWEEYLGRKS